MKRIRWAIIIAIAIMVMGCGAAILGAMQQPGLGVSLKDVPIYPQANSIKEWTPPPESGKLDSVEGIGFIASEGPTTVNDYYESWLTQHGWSGQSTFEGDEFHLTYWLPQQDGVKLTTAALSIGSFKAPWFRVEPRLRMHKLRGWIEPLHIETGPEEGRARNITAEVHLSLIVFSVP